MQAVNRVVDCTRTKALTMVAAACVSVCVCVGSCLISRVGSHLNSVAIVVSPLGKCRYANIDIELISLLLRMETEPGSPGFPKALLILHRRWSYLSWVPRPQQNLLFSLGGFAAFDRETNERAQGNDRRGTSIHHCVIVFTCVRCSTRGKERNYNDV